MQPITYACQSMFLFNEVSFNNSVTRNIAILMSRVQWHEVENASGKDKNGGH